eukprot:CAMPEP_0115184704 /NCGR_PEP_ID=MMETSP0270-20121206/9098_1 /TAXON_ID=71861 /ORGANISM="Scrippsiella trochoidea, Strain CCMP3099" /LENGTH=120 /DNA_ID=CAMNT_0002597795 /DNA_START=134 /DNA_END=497 /DNA_ORIENTATION=+
MTSAQSPQSNTMSFFLRSMAAGLIVLVVAAFVWWTEALCERKALPGFGSAAAANEQAAWAEAMQVILIFSIAGAAGKKALSSTTSLPSHDGTDGEMPTRTLLKCPILLESVALGGPLNIC